MASNANPNAAAVLVWLPKGVTPTIDTSGAVAANGHPTIQPIAYWLLSEALHVAETDKSHPDEDPWIKSGDSLFDRQEIHDLHVAAQAFTKLLRQQDADDA